MSFYQVHYKAMKALLGQSTFSVTEACPFAPMLRGRGEELASHYASLLRQGILLDGSLLCEEAQQSLHVIAQPQHCLKLTFFSLGSSQHTSYFFQDNLAVLAGFDHQETCSFSKPITLDRLAENLTKQLVPTAKKVGRALRLPPELLRVFAVWMDEGMRLQPPREAAEAYRRSALSRGALLQELGEPLVGQGDALLGSLLEHRFLLEEDGLFWFGPEFQAWYEVLSGDERVELQVRTLPVRESKVPDRGMIFVGSAEQRLGLWSRGQKEILWAFWPEQKIVRALLRDLLRCGDQEDQEFLESTFSRGVILDGI